MKQKVGLPVPKGPKTANLYIIGAEVTTITGLYPVVRPPFPPESVCWGRGGGAF